MITSTVIRLRMGTSIQIDRKNKIFFQFLSVRRRDKNSD